jgi:hypothetical protein
LTFAVHSQNFGVLSWALLFHTFLQFWRKCISIYSNKLRAYTCSNSICALHLENTAYDIKGFDFNPNKE